jgi:hypothetical protein
MESTPGRLSPTSVALQIDVSKWVRLDSDEIGERIVLYSEQPVAFQGYSFPVLGEPKSEAVQGLF